MGQKETLLGAILAEPGDLPVRLAYADWLEEHGQAESDHARSEFIRLQCRMEEMDEWSPERLDLVQREQELLLDHREGWLQELPFWARKVPCTFRKGFVALVEAPVKQFLRGGQALFCATPLEGVRLTDGTVEQVLACPQLERLTHLDLVTLKGGIPTDWAPFEQVQRLRPPAQNRQQWVEAISTPGKWSNLTHLDYQFSSVALGDLAVLINSEHLTKLVSLGGKSFGYGGHSWLYSERASDATAARAISNSTALRRLRALEFDGPLMNDEIFAILATSPHLIGLQYLNPGEGRTSAVGIRALAASASLPSLRALEIENSSLSAEGVVALVESPHLAGLTSLSLRSGDEGALALARSPFLRNLRILRLSWGNLTDRGAVTLATSPNLAHLTELDLRHNPLTSTSAQALANSPHLSRLHTLDLGGTRIGDAGLCALASSTNLPNLRRLNLHECGIRPAGVEALASSPQRSELRALRLHDNSIEQRGRQALASSPHLNNLRELWVSGVDRHTRPALRERFGSGVRF